MLLHLKSFQTKQAEMRYDLPDVEEINAGILLRIARHAIDSDL